MAKIYGLNGVISGRQGNNVFRVRNGIQVVAKYQPVVLDTKSSGQIESRAKFKLMSGLAAIFRPVLVMKRQGGATSGNMFVKKNYGLATYNSGNMEADINLQQIAITDGLIPLGSFGSTTRTDQGVQMALVPGSESVDLDRVVYIMYAKTALGNLVYRGSVVAVSAGTSNTWPALLPAESREFVVYAYGVRITSERARYTFSRVTATTAEQMAKVLVSMSESEGIEYTRTLAAQVPAQA